MTSRATFREYRPAFPSRMTTPTLTQSGLLGLILKRQRQKTTRAAVRRARIRRVFAAIETLPARSYDALGVLFSGHQPTARRNA